MAALTMAVIMKIQELIAPLCYYAQSIFEESHNNEKSADRGKVTVRPSASRLLPRRSRRKARIPRPTKWDNVRLHRLSDGIEHVLDLTGVLSDGVERTAFLSRLVHAATVAWGSHAVATRVASHCRHVDGFRIPSLDDS